MVTETICRNAVASKNWEFHQYSLPSFGPMSQSNLFFFEGMPKLLKHFKIVLSRQQVTKLVSMKRNHWVIKTPIKYCNQETRMKENLNF